MRRWNYFYQGLRIGAEFPLPDWDLFATSDLAAEPDVTISIDSGIEARELRSIGSDPAPEDEYSFFVPGIGLFKVAGGREITVAPLSGIQTDALQPWLAGSVWGALCYQRGLLILHASAVGRTDGAIAFCGLARTGKSTMAAHLHAQGHALVSDDLCRVDISTEGPVLIHPSVPRLKLSKEVLAGLGRELADVPGESVSRTGKLNIWTENRSIEPLPLRAIYILGWGEWKLRQLTGAEALSRFLAAAIYRSELLASMKRSAPYANLCLELLRQVPLWEHTRRVESPVERNTVRFITELNGMAL
jgi:hypothetical protein